MARLTVCPTASPVTVPPGLEIRWRKGALPGRALNGDDRNWWTAQIGDMVAETWMADSDYPNVWGVEVDWMPFDRFRAVSLTGPDSAMACADRAIVRMFWKSLWEQKRTVAATRPVRRLHGGKIRRDAYRLASALGA